MDALREKSVRLTGYLEFLLERGVADKVKVLTPGELTHAGPAVGRGAGRRPIRHQA